MPFYRVNEPIQPEGEAATRSFFVGASGVVAIEATPLGIVVRRQESLVDLLLCPGGWGIIEKPKTEQPAQLRRKP